jgi:cytoskeletal protein CcmA (bactofilin family)
MALFSSGKDPNPPRPQPRSGDGTPMPNGTFFGPNVTIEGTVTGSEPVIVEGTIRGKINLTGDLRVGTQARVEATVHAKNVTVEGRLTGDISADDRVELVTTATVDGNIKAPKIIVAEGARFRGNVDMGSTKPSSEREQNHNNHGPARQQRER